MKISRDENFECWAAYFWVAGLKMFPEGEITPARLLDLIDAAEAKHGLQFSLDFRIALGGELITSIP